MTERMPRMSRRCALLYGLVLAAAATMILQAASGLVLWLALPHGQGGGGGRGYGRGLREAGSGLERAFAGIERSTWVTIHDWAAVIFVAVVVFHVALHWKWVVRQTRNLLAGRSPVAASRAD